MAANRVVRQGSQEVQNGVPNRELVLLHTRARVGVNKGFGTPFRAIWTPFGPLLEGSEQPQSLYITSLHNHHHMILRILDQRDLILRDGVHDVIIPSKYLLRKGLQIGHYGPLWAYLHRYGVHEIIASLHLLDPPSICVQMGCYY